MKFNSQSIKWDCIVRGVGIFGDRKGGGGGPATGNGGQGSDIAQKGVVKGT